MKTIQKGAVGAAVAETFGTKGRTSPQLDETMVLNARLMDIEDSPYRIPIPCVGYSLQAAVPANYSYVFIKGAPDRITVVRSIFVGAPYAAPVSALVSLMTIAQVDALTAKSQRTMLGLKDPHQRVAAAVGEAYFAGVTGNTMGYVFVPTDASFVLPLRVPYILYPPGLGFMGLEAIAVIGSTVNQGLSATWEADLYDLPGL